MAKVLVELHLQQVAIEWDGTDESWAQIVDLWERTNDDEYVVIQGRPGVIECASHHIDIPQGSVFFTLDEDMFGPQPMNWLTPRQSRNFRILEELES